MNFVDMNLDVIKVIVSYLLLARDKIHLYKTCKLYYDKESMLNLTMLFLKSENKKLTYTCDGYKCIVLSQTINSLYSLLCYNPLTTLINIQFRTYDRNNPPANRLI